MAGIFPAIILFHRTTQLSEVGTSEQRVATAAELSP
jgi:hypothetical protein